MLGKLLKYEIKGTARTMLPLYAALLVLTFINKIFLSISSNATGFQITSGISMALYSCIIIGLFVLTFVVIVQRFYKNLMTDEGYLMFTLPVSAWQHIVAKLIIALMWTIICILITALSIFIIAVNGNTIMEIGLLFSHMIAVLSETNAALNFWILTECLVVALLTTAIGILQIYASIAIGQLSGNHKVIASFGSYIAINIVLQIIATIFILSFGFSVSSVDALSRFFISLDPYAMVQLILGIYTLISLVLGSAFFFGTKYLLNNKLNLE